MASIGQQYQNTTLYYSPFMQNDRDEPEDFEYMDNDGTTTPPTPYWVKDGDDSDSDNQEIIPAAPSAAVYNHNDPLRYCLQTGLVSADEYAKWKIVNEMPSMPTTATSAKPKRPIIDYGPLYESDSDDPTKKEINIVMVTDT